MDVIRREAPRPAPFPLLPSCVVDTNEALRQRALRLVTLGCSQKILAAKMGMQASTFSRWLNQKNDVGPVSVTALDGFNAYVEELADALASDSIRDPDVAESDTSRAGTGGSLKKRHGHTLATSGQADQADSVPGAASAAVRRAATDLLRPARDVESADRLATPTRPARVVGQHAPAPPAPKSGHRPVPRKRRR
jgi:transcriptional regulator with XRE-family HTH domain